MKSISVKHAIKISGLEEIDSRLGLTEKVEAVENSDKLVRVGMKKEWEIPGLSAG